jgi:hypothetical protein
MGITLIPIPYWWNKTAGSLAATLSSYRPDFSFSSDVLSDERAIPLDMPPATSNKIKYIPNASKYYDERVDPSGWYMMEMFDGVRVFWDGSLLYAKTTRELIHVPQECNFPTMPFEGELW